MSGQVLEGYKKNSHGHLLPIAGIKELDLLRDDTVTKIINHALILQAHMRDFKLKTLQDITAFVSISAEQYGADIGGKKGNLSLVSFDGKYKVVVAVSDTLNFDERLQVAKSLVDECIHEWSAQSNVQIRTLIEHAFQTDKLGNINTARIFGLMRVKIEDEKWIRAMEALKDSIQVTATSQYLRLYEREGESTQYKQIALDIAGL